MLTLQRGSKGAKDLTLQAIGQQLIQRLGAKCGPLQLEPAAGAAQPFAWGDHGCSLVASVLLMARRVVHPPRR